MGGAPPSPTSAPAQLAKSAPTLTSTSAPRWPRLTTGVPPSPRRLTPILTEVVTARRLRRPVRPRDRHAPSAVQSSHRHPTARRQAGSAADGSSSRPFIRVSYPQQPRTSETISSTTVCPPQAKQAAVGVPPAELERPAPAHPPAAATSPPPTATPTPAPASRSRGAGGTPTGAVNPAQSPPMTSGAAPTPYPQLLRPFAPTASPTVGYPSAWARATSPRARFAASAGPSKMNAE